MKKEKVLLASILSIGVITGLVSCNGGSNSDSSSSDSQSQANQLDAANLAQYYQGSVQADVQNVGEGPGLMLGEMQAFSSFSFPLGGVFFMPDSSCVTVANNSTSSEKDYVYTISCKNMNGTVEVKSSDSAGDSSFEIITNVSLSDPNNANDTSSINSDNSVSNASGVLTISKQFDDKFSNGTNSYEVKGSSNDVVTPTDSSNPRNGGSIQLSSSIQYFKNGAQDGNYSVSSSGLEYSSCGLSAGSITFVDGANTFVLTFNGCGMPSLTKNGEPVTWPSPSPMPMPSQSPVVMPSPSGSPVGSSH